jgi:hypothetical protein
MSDAANRLRSMLGADLPPSVAALDEAHQQDLVGVVEEARRRQAQGLEEAFTATLKHVPFPARGIVKRVLLG